MALVDVSDWASTLGIPEEAAAAIVGGLIVTMTALMFGGMYKRLTGPGALLGIGLAASMGVWPIWTAIILGCAGAAMILFMGVRNFGS